MRKSTLLILFSSCFFGLLIGQNKWNFSPSVIIGYSGEQASHKSSSENTTGYSYSLEEKKLLPTLGAGFTVERFIGPRFGLNLGVQYLYSQLLDRIEHSYSTFEGVPLSYYYSEYEKKLNTHQIRVPLQFHFYFGKPQGIRPYIGLGGLTTYLISAVDYSESLSVSTNETYHNYWVQKYDFKNEWNGLNRFNISMNYVIGIEFNRFSIEFNRTQNAFKKNKYIGSPYYYCRCFYIEFPEEKTQATTMSLKYKL